VPKYHLPSCSFEELTDAQLAELAPLLEAIEACLAAEPQKIPLGNDFAGYLRDFGLTIEDMRDQDLVWHFDRIEGDQLPDASSRIKGKANRRAARQMLLQVLAEPFARDRKASKASAERSHHRGHETARIVKEAFTTARTKEPGGKDEAVLAELKQRHGISRRTEHRYEPPR
jgi:hypothetical protein